MGFAGDSYDMMPCVRCMVRNLEIADARRFQNKTLLNVDRN